MDRLQSMSIFVTAVEEGSLSAAARQLRMPLTTVSRNVSELEAHLKTRLLNRSSRKLTLTDAGRTYVTACKQILEYVGEAERGASGEYSAPKGNLNITTLSCSDVCISFPSWRNSSRPIRTSTSE